MNCLICQTVVEQTFFFNHLFLLKEAPELVCSDCQQSFEQLDDDLCQRCCKRSDETICQDCQVWEKKGIVINHQSLFAYNSAMKDYFQKYKFQGDYLLRKVFAQDIKTFLKNCGDYTVVPVPVSPETYQERGFNQVEGFLEAAEVSYQSLLTKEESIKQSHLNRRERLEMKNHYQLVASEPIPEKVLVVDDIYTTGATLQSIVTILRESGVKEVKTFSLCR